MITPEEQEILDRSQKMGDAWNQGDARAVASFFTEDGIRIGPDGTESHGRTEIESAYRQMNEELGGAQVKMEQPSIRLITPELALVNAYIELSGGAVQPIKGHTLEVWQKTGGSWMVLEAHPKIFT